MKKVSYAALLGLVLLVSTVIAATTPRLPLVNAAGMDNNPILSAINNGVNTILNAITNAQNNINVHTDADTNVLASNSLTFDKTFVLGPNEGQTLVLLPGVPDRTYSGHVTLTFDIIGGGGNSILDLVAYLSETNVYVGKADSTVRLIN
jgi:hypothetical protein